MLKNFDCRIESSLAQRWNETGLSFVSTDIHIFRRILRLIAEMLCEFRIGAIGQLLSSLGRDPMAS